MILTVEPIFSDLPDFQIGNFAMEQILLVTETGTELLTPFTDELWIAPASLETSACRRRSARCPVEAASPRSKSSRPGSR